MMLCRKIPYYISSLVRLIRATRNPVSLAGPWLGKTATVKFRNGISLRIPTPLDLLIAKETLLDDCYRLGDVVHTGRIIDVGASLGDFTILAAKCFPAAEVLAFEPRRQYFELLQENLEINRVNNVTAHNVPVGRHSGGLPLADFLDSTASFVKLDCEGAERDIINELSPENLQAVSRIALEYHRLDLSGAEADLAEYLGRCGFQCTCQADRYNHCIGYIYAMRREADTC